MGRKRSSKEVTEVREDKRKRRRIDDSTSYERSIYQGQISDSDKSRLLQIHLRQFSTGGDHNALVQLATRHGVRRADKAAMLSHLYCHNCSWDCKISSEEIVLLQDEASLSPVYDTDIKTNEKCLILNALLTLRYEEMSNPRRKALLQEHGVSDEGKKVEIEALREHQCRETCRLRAEDVNWYQTNVDVIQLLSREEIVRERQRRSRQKKKTEIENITEEEITYWQQNWPQVETEETLKEILRESCDAAKAENLKRASCSFCDLFDSVQKVQPIPKNLMDISKLEENVQIILEEYPECKVESHRRTDSPYYMICEACRKHVRLDESKRRYQFRSVPTFSWANGCWIGESPPELEGLTYAEQIIIARALTTKCWAKINVVGGKSNPATRQRAASGNVCIHPHEITDIATSLPRPINSLFDEIAVIIVTGHQEATASMFEKTPLLARRGRILRALLWLKEHNPLYADIIIDYTMLQQYPESGIVNFPAHLERRDNVPSGASTTYSGHGIDKVEDLLERDEESSSDNIPISRTGSIDVNRVEVSLEKRKIEALRHIKQGGSFLATARSTSTLSTYETPQTYGYLWPTLFPYGVGYIDDPVRKKKGFKAIHTASHVKHLLRISDRRFQLHTSFIFVMHNLLTRRRSSWQAKVAVQRPWWKRVMKILKTVDHSTFINMKDEMLKMRAAKDFSLYRAKNEAEKKVLQLLKYVSFIDNHIEGSIGEVSAMREELRAITRYAGTPSLFITINPADAHHPLVSFFAGEDIDVDRLFDNPDSRYTSLKRAQILADNPVAGAMFFDFIINRFVDIFMGYARSSRRGVFGRVKFHYGVGEAQNRGSLHLHALIWLEGAESPKAIQDRCNTDPVFKQRFFDWLESLIKLSFPNEEVILPKGSYEQSRRSLLGQPPHPDDHTFNQQWPIYLGELLECVGQRHSHGDVCFKKCHRSASAMTAKEQDEKCRFHLPADLVPSTFIDDDGKIHLRRGDAMVSGYNPIITGANQCNTDIKFVGSGRLGMAMATYMSNYTAKSTLDSAIVMSAICAAIASLQAKHNGENFTAEQDQCQLLLLKTLNQITARRELSGQQVASSLLGIPNHFTNARFVRVYWSSVLTWICNEEYPLMVKEIEKEEDEDEGEDSNATNCDDSDDVEGEAPTTEEETTLSNEWIVIDSVAQDADNAPPPRSPLFDVLFRPRQLDALSWWDVLSKYKKVRLPQESDVPAENSEVNPRPYLRFEQGHPERDTHALRQRKKIHIPVLIGYAIPRRTLPEGERGVSDKYAIAMLALFRPWRRDPCSPLKEQPVSWIEEYESWLPQATAETRSFMNHFEEVWECRQAADDYSMSRRVLEDMRTPNSGASPSTGESTLDDPLFLLGQRSDEGDESEWDTSPIEDQFSLTCSDRALNDIHRILNFAKIGLLYTTPSQPMETNKDVGTALHLLETDDRHLAAAATDKLADEKAKKCEMMKEKLSVLHTDDTNTIQNTTGCAPKPRLTTLRDEMARREERVMKMSEEKRKAWQTLHEWQKLAIVACEQYSLNKEQKQAFLLAVDHRIRKVTDADTPPLRLIIGGPGGSGKSHIYDVLRTFYESISLSHELAFTAPTGVASDRVQGSTIHSFLALNSDYNKLCETNNKTRNNLSQRLAVTKLLVIDEAYFLSCREFNKVSKNIKVGRAFSDDALGGMDIILSGDQFQFSCPIGQSLYCKDYAERTSDVQGQSDTVKEEMEGFSTFRGFADCVITKEIMRQKNHRFVEFINRLRWGICTTTGVDNDYDYIRKFSMKGMRRSTKDFGADVCQWINDPSSAPPLITFTNAVRDVHNWEMTKCFCAATHQEFKIYYSEDYICGQTRGSHIRLTGGNATAAWNTPAKKNADDLAGKLPLAVGMPVILVENLAVELGLCKSTRGTLLSLNYFIRDGMRSAVCADVEFPSYKGEGENRVVTIPTVRRSFSYERNGKRFTAYREQLPIIPGFAFTIHNSQGQTLPSMIVHLESARGTAAAYVALSRIKCGETDPIKLRIIGEINKKKISTHAPSEVRMEEQRLTALAAETAKRWKDRLECIPHFASSQATATMPEYKTSFSLPMPATLPVAAIASTLKIHRDRNRGYNMRFHPYDISDNDIQRKIGEKMSHDGENDAIIPKGLPYNRK